jgi:hypothetical protein
VIPWQMTLVFRSTRMGISLLCFTSVVWSSSLSTSVDALA